MLCFLLNESCATFWYQLDSLLLVVKGDRLFQQGLLRDVMRGSGFK